jgi:hypothetical protein
MSNRYLHHCSIIFILLGIFFFFYSYEVNYPDFLNTIRPRNILNIISFIMFIASLFCVYYSLKEEKTFFKFMILIITILCFFIMVCQYILFLIFYSIIGDSAFSL